MYKNNGNQSGFTLIEILLSIVILSIILTTFAGFFTQSSMFNRKNEQKLSTMQVAQIIVKTIDAKVKEKDLQQSIWEKLNSTESNNSCTINGLSEIKTNLIPSLDLSYQTQYDVTVILSKKSQDFTTNQGEAISIPLVQAEIVVQNGETGNQEQSNTFTYLRK